MKKFEDLKFKPHPNIFGGNQAVMNFDNGFGVSVIQGRGLYSHVPDGSDPSVLGTFEVGILCQGELSNTPLGEEIFGYQCPSQVSEIMRKLQLYKF